METLVKLIILAGCGQKCLGMTNAQSEVTKRQYLGKGLSNFVSFMKAAMLSCSFSWV